MAKEPKKIKKPSSLSEAARQLGHAGGLVGGKARAEALSAEERSQIAKQGGLAKAARSKALKSKIKRKKGK